MKLEVNVKLDHAEINGTIDIDKLTVLIGPNISGKSLILKCIYSSLKSTKYILSIPFNELSDCKIDENNFDYIIYNDIYSIVYFIYDKYRKEFEYYLDDTENPNYTFFTKMSNDLKTLDLLNEIRLMVTDESISKANNEIEDKLKKVGLDEESNYILLLRIFPTSGDLEWKDYSGEEGQGVQDLSPSFYSSSIVTLMQYTYALSLKKKVLLLLDELDAFAHPILAYFLGKLIHRLVSKSHNLYVVTVTHNWDFFKGIIEGDLPKVYVVKRKGKNVEFSEWKGEIYIPGFSTSSVIGE
jgi:predicted ATPase